jgi:vanillate O-demethylase monooxygenase subunit
MCNTEHVAKAPLDLTLDNFCEIEHTPTTHELFGYALDRMHEVTVRVETTDDSVTVINHGPPKRINPILSFFIGIKKNHIFNDTWTTYFSPVYSVYDHVWMDPKTGKEASVKWRVYVFFTPVHDMETRVTAFTFAKSKWWAKPQGGLLAWRGYMRRSVNREIGYDVDILEGLASHNTGVEGMKLSRFDKALVFNRERVAKVYRGETEPSRQLRLASGE